MLCLAFQKGQLKWADGTPVGYMDWKNNYNLLHTRNWITKIAYFMILTRDFESYLQPISSPYTACATILTRNLADPRWILSKCDQRFSDGFVCKHKIDTPTNDTNLDRLHMIYDNLYQCGQTHIMLHFTCFLLHYKHKNMTVDDMHNECKISEDVLFPYDFQLYRKIFPTFEKWNEYQLYPDNYVAGIANTSNQCVVFVQQDTK